MARNSNFLKKLLRNLNFSNFCLKNFFCKKFVKYMKNSAKNIFRGVAMALLAGCFFGCVFLPIFYIQDNAELFNDAPKTLLPYLFSQFLGIMVASNIIFLLYLIAK